MKIEKTKEQQNALKLQWTHWCQFFRQLVMFALTTCLCMLRFYPIPFIFYARRLWSTLITYFGFLRNNNRSILFKNGFLIAKGIPVAQIGFNDVFDFVHVVYIRANMDMGTHCNDVVTRISVGLKSSTLIVTFVQYNIPCFSSSLCDMIKWLLNILSFQYYIF